MQLLDQLSLDARLVQHHTYELVRDVLLESGLSFDEERKRLALLATFSCPDRYLSDFIHVLASLELKAALASSHISLLDKKLRTLCDKMKLAEIHTFAMQVGYVCCNAVCRKDQTPLNFCYVIQGDKLVNQNDIQEAQEKLERDLNEVLCQLASECLRRCRSALMPRHPEGLVGGPPADYLDSAIAHLSLAMSYLLSVDDINESIKVWNGVFEETEDRMNKEAAELLRVKVSPHSLHPRLL